MTRPEEPRAPGELRRAACIAALATLLGAVTGRALLREPAGSQPPAPPTPAPLRADPAVSALLAPLRVGDRLGPLTIAAIGPVEHGLIRVELAGSPPLALSIARAAGATTPPPVVAGAYALYYSGASEATFDAALARLREVLLAHASLPLPAGLAPFTARDEPRAR